MIAMVVKSVVQPFSERSALGQYWLRDLDNGAFRQESYVAHISMPSHSPLYPGFTYTKRQIFPVEMVLLC